MAVKRINITDKEQAELELATFEGGIPVFKNGVTRVIAKGANGSAERVSSASRKTNSNAGVIMPFSDIQNRFPEETQGK